MTPAVPDSPVGRAVGEKADGVALSLIDRIQPMLLLASIGAGLGLAAIAPGLAGSLSPLVSIAVLALIYLVMLGLDASAVMRSLRDRRFLAVAVGLNFVINPLMAWGISRIFLDGQPDLRLGLILFLVTPCIGWYLVFTDLAGGDTGLGVSLLGINVVLQVALLPLYLLLFEGRTAGLDAGSLLSSIVLFLVVPAVAATATQTACRAGGREITQMTGAVDHFYLKTVALVVVIVAMFASQAEVIFERPGVVLRLIAPLTVFFVAAFVIAIVAGRLAGLPYEQMALLAFTATSRNSEASLAIAATAFASPLAALAVVLGPVIELPLLVLMVRVLLGLRHRVMRSAKESGRSDRLDVAPAHVNPVEAPS